MSRGRKGRGRLSVIDMLPAWADPCVAKAFEALKDGKIPQIEILEQFNADLRAAAWAEGISDPPQISKSAFNRSSLRLATMARRLGDTREIAGVLASKFEGGGDEDLTLLLGETIKALTYEMLENAGQLQANGFTAEMLMNCARALKHAEEAKKITADVKTKIVKEFKATTETAVDKVGKERGWSQDTISDVKARLLGLRTPEKAAS